MQGVRGGEDHRRRRTIGERFIPPGHEPEVMLRGEVAPPVHFRFDTDDEAQLVRFSLDRLDEAAAPAAEADDRGVDHSGWIPASRISFVHLAISCLMNAANSSGGIGAAWSPTRGSRALTSGLARLADTTSCSFATTAFGVLAGATRPYQMRVSK